MKVVILAGGRGSRLAEETQSVPKPMVEIGNRPLLWHIMKIFSFYGHNEFIICLGYKSKVIKDFFLRYDSYNSDIDVALKSGKVSVVASHNDDWLVRLVDTGEDTQTGGRLKRVADQLPIDEPFFFTYGDGVANINLDKLVDFHNRKGVLATVTAVSPPGRFGAMKLNSESFVTSFSEKPIGEFGSVNGGFFVLQKEALAYIENDDTIWERSPLEHLARENKLAAYRHSGFWQPMDTLRDKLHLEQLWKEGDAPWKIWQSD